MAAALRGWQLVTVCFGRVDASTWFARRTSLAGDGSIDSVGSLSHSISQGRGQRHTPGHRPADVPGTYVTSDLEPRSGADGADSTGGLVMEGRRFNPDRRLSQESKVGGPCRAPVTNRNRRGTFR